VLALGQQHVPERPGRRRAGDVAQLHALRDHEAVDNDLEGRWRLGAIGRGCGPLGGGRINMRQVVRSGARAAATLRSHMARMIGAASASLAAPVDLPIL